MWQLWTTFVVAVAMAAETDKFEIKLPIAQDPRALQYYLEIEIGEKRIPMRALVNIGF